MKKAKFFIILFLLLCFLRGIAGAEVSLDDLEKVAASDPHYREHPFMVPGGIVVDFRDDTPMKHVEKLEKDLGVDLDFVSRFSRDERLMRGVVDEDNLENVLANFKKDSSVEYAEPDYYLHAFALRPNDPMYKYQWNFEKINVRGAWDFTRGKGVTVAVIDTGVTSVDGGRFHRVEDLEKTGFAPGYNFVDKNNKPYDDNAHGTHVAGTIAQSTHNKKGVAGIAYESRIMPLKVLNSSGFGRVSDIAAAVRYAADNKAKVINMSLGGPFPSLSLKAACSYAWRKGVVIVCAAGNSRSTRPFYPAAFSECISVSATRYDDQLAPYSNRGKSIDIAAPGGDTSVDQNGDGKPDGVLQNTIQIRNPEKEGYYFFQGTSMAAPHVAAVAAMVASTGVTGNRDIVNILKKTARKKGLPLEKGYGAGIVDARAAVASSIMGAGWIKLLIAVVILILILWVFKPKTSLMFIVTALVTSSGLFFIPYLAKKSFPGMSLLVKGIPEWDTVIFGPAAHANPLFFSVLIPFILAVLLYKTRLQKLAAGISAGFAANVLYQALFSSADVQWIPGTFFLDKTWLLFNCILCVILARILLHFAPKSGTGISKTRE